MQPLIDTLRELGITDAEELKSVIVKSRETGFDVIVNELAAKHGVDAVVLKDKAKRLDLKDRAQIDEIASVLPKKAVVPTTDGGKISGGSAEKSYEQKLKERYPKM